MLLLIFPAGLKKPHAIWYHGVCSLLATVLCLLVFLELKVEKSRSSKKMTTFSLSVKLVSRSLKTIVSSQVGWRLSLSKEITQSCYFFTLHDINFHTIKTPFTCCLYICTVGSKQVKCNPHQGFPSHKMR